MSVLLPQAGIKVRPVTRGLVFLLRGYKRFLSPLLPQACRFTPTCSVYFMEAVERHGALRGTQLGLRRLFRCHPFNPGGYDPVELPPADRHAEEF